MQFIRISMLMGHKLTAVLKTAKVSIRGHAGKSLMEVIPNLTNHAKMCVCLYKAYKTFPVSHIVMPKHS